MAYGRRRGRDRRFPASVVQAPPVRSAQAFGDHREAPLSRTGRGSWRPCISTHGENRREKTQSTSGVSMTLAGDLPTRHRRTDSVQAASRMSRARLPVPAVRLPALQSRRIDRTHSRWHERGQRHRSSTRDRGRGRLRDSRPRHPGAGWPASGGKACGHVKYPEECFGRSVCRTNHVAPIKGTRNSRAPTHFYTTGRSDKRGHTPRQPHNGLDALRRQ